MTEPTPPLIAHRLGRAYGPDNSAQALERSLGGRVDGLEADLCLTSDDQLVVLHEPYLPLGTNLEGWVHEHTAASVRQGRLRGRDGKTTDQAPLLLDELLDAVPDGLPLELEVRAYGDASVARRTAARLCEHYSSHPAYQRLEVISFWPEACGEAAAHGLRSRLIIWSRYTPEALASWAVDCGVAGVLVEHFLLSAEVVEALRRRGLSVTTGTVNESGLLERVLAFSPDAVTTDNPHELRVT